MTQSPAAQTRVSADPYDWPFDGASEPGNTGLIVIDMQMDFCGYGGYCDQMGIDMSLTRRPIEPLMTLLERMRERGFHILHTREGHRSDLSDLNENKRWRSARNGAQIGSRGPLGRILVRGEPGWEIVPELAPRAGEPVIDKSGKGAFYATDLDQILRQRGIRNLIIAGVTTDCCVYTTLRGATTIGSAMSACCSKIAAPLQKSRITRRSSASPRPATGSWARTVSNSAHVLEAFA